MQGAIKALSVDDDDRAQKQQATSGVFGMFKGLVGGKSLTEEDMAPILDKLKDHLIAKNVAADVAIKLCDSVGTKLVGKVRRYQ